MKFLKKLNDKFFWYAAVGYDMVPEFVARNWQILPEKIVPAVIQGWTINLKDENRLVVEPVEDVAMINRNAKANQHFLTLLYWMPVSNVN